MSNETQQYAVVTDVEQRPDPASAAAPDAPETPRPVRWNVVRDVCAAVLLALALLVPWNVSFGLGVPTNTWWLFAVVVGATMLALVALAASNGGPLSTSESIDKVRLGLTAPYLLVVLGFVGFAIYELVNLSGGGATPPGVGPGVLLGAAGAFLGAQPVLTGDRDRRRFVGWFVLASRVASWAKFFVLASVLLTLYLRTRDVLPNVFDGSIAWPSIATVLTAIAYAAVALVAVWIGLRWMQQEEMDAGLATIALGAATLVGALLVWFLPLGRDVDAFHGIAQATSTAGVGFEGYLAWAVGAAIFAPAILWQAFTTKPLQAAVWREAVRKCLLLIAVWCVGSAVLRIFDVIVELASGLPFSPSDSALLFVFDLASAGLAYWIRANIGVASQHSAALSRLSGVLFVLLACRVALGVGLARPILYATTPEDAAVYGNSLAHQITSTFDVVLCLLALIVLAVLVVVPRRAVNRDASTPAEAVASPEVGTAPPAPPAEAVAAPQAGLAPQSQPAPRARAAAAPSVPFWQAPSQWASPEPHEGLEDFAPEPEPQAPAPEQSESEEAPPSVDVTEDSEQAESDESDESSSEAEAYASSGRHRHRHRSAPESTED